MSHSPTKDWRWPEPEVIASATMKPGEMLILPGDPWGALTAGEQAEVLLLEGIDERITKVADILVRSRRAVKVTGLNGG